jgi:hypothetical protein
MGPWHVVQMDFKGPFPTMEGTPHKYLLTYVDMFSRYSLVWPCPRADAATALECFKEAILQFGVPHTIQTDCGSHFEGSFSSHLDELGIPLRNTHAYHSEAQGITGAVHLKLQTILRKVCPPGKLHLWPDLVKVLQFHLNNRANRDLGGISPHECLFGHKIRTLDDQRYGHTLPELTAEDWHELTDTIQARTAVCATLAAMHNAGAHAASHKPTKALLPDTHCIVWFPIRESKFHSHWRGPYTIRTGPDQYGFYVVAAIRPHGKLGREEVVISHRLRPFDMSRVDMAAIFDAALDVGVFIVEDILDVRLRAPPNEKEHEFLTRYRGLNDPVWQLSSTLIKLTLFKEYAKAQGIPWSHLLSESKQQNERDALHV